MTTLFWISAAGFSISLIALIGAITLLLSEGAFQRLLLPWVAISAGSLIGGALFHMLPEAVQSLKGDCLLYLLTACGFVLFFMMEQLFSWHPCHLPLSQHRHPVTYLMLLSDAVHNFIDGTAVAAGFMVDLRLGFAAWLVVAAHEIPQELGDFGVMIYWGWSKGRALLFNFLSGLTFLGGALITYVLAPQLRVAWLPPFAAGAFLYVGAVDLVPEIKAGHERKKIWMHTLCFMVGLFGLYLLKIAFAHH